MFHPSYLTLAYRCPGPSSSPMWPLKDSFFPKSSMNFNIWSTKPTSPLAAPSSLLLLSFLVIVLVNSLVKMLLCLEMSCTSDERIREICQTYRAAVEQGPPAACMLWQGADAQERGQERRCFWSLLGDVVLFLAYGAQVLSIAQVHNPPPPQDLDGWF